MKDYETPSGEPEKDLSSVFHPIQLAIRDRHLAGKRTSIAEETLAARKAYAEELKGDLDEILDAIMEEESLEKALSLLSKKFAIERTLLAAERNIMAEERSLLAEKRTRAAFKRNKLAEKRSGLARIRTLLAKNRSFLAEKRAIMAQQRTFLAKARTELAFIRTGVAFVALGTGLTRYFGLGWWSIMDATIFLMGLGMIVMGVYYYLPTRKKEGHLIDIIKQKEDELMRRKPRIMVLDDDASVCSTLKLYLKKAGYDVEAFVNPHVAKQRLESVQFDVVITDMMMEGITGLQILQTAKRISPNTQVIMLSRIQMPKRAIEKAGEDLFDYFTKPVNIKDLLDSVHRAVEERILI